MKKIPSLFIRDHNTGLVIPELNSKAAWVMEDAYPAFQKFDGTCVAMFLSLKGGLPRIHEGIGSGEVEKKSDLKEVWFARRAVHGRMLPPEGFIEEEFDATTSKTFGWEPIENSPYYKYFQEAVTTLPKRYIGTYELCGPKINGNPEGYDKHTLVFHEDAPQLANIQVLDIHEMSVEDAFDALKQTLAFMPIEGVIWKSHAHGMAKLKKKDFGLERESLGKR